MDSQAPRFDDITKQSNLFLSFNLNEDNNRYFYQGGMG